MNPTIPKEIPTIRASPAKNGVIKPVIPLSLPIGKAELVYKENIMLYNVPVECGRGEERRRIEGNIGLFLKKQIFFAPHFKKKQKNKIFLLVMKKQKLQIFMERSYLFLNCFILTSFFVSYYNEYSRFEGKTKPKHKLDESRKIAKSAGTDKAKSLEGKADQSESRDELKAGSWGFSQKYQPFIIGVGA